MAEGATNGGNGYGKWAAGVMAVAALVGIPMALQVPQGQRIDFNKEAITSLRVDLEHHRKEESHHDTVRALAELSERFKEVETQFRWFREAHDLRLKPIEAWQGRWAERMEDLYSQRSVESRPR